MTGAWMCFVAIMSYGERPLYDMAINTAYVDVIEYNHKCDVALDGFPISGFDQIIYWRWAPSQRKYEVLAYQMPRETEWQVRPFYCHASRRWIAVFWHKEILVKLYAKSFRETWTMHDPEVDDHRFVQPSERRGLW